ncbi:WGxxGxxG-CTERM domain-containing protein [Sphingomonas sp. SM33]|jgi:MYXO-CTERM domain-containing protein|uniref:WGxxGxxG-CTERM domain-containing protein n=1 Tax=Sphingomonas telluris TaxID=2907998 RepID=A0ABS9VK45_9SPHN|nr:WGxxGxxG-CTERM domain-containing protein [Sphingomonas telluris]MCH8615329.1 WGxxGxxG-CTERM domain-containing protein [Sphingomonas telluris]
MRNATVFILAAALIAAPAAAQNDTNASTDAANVTATNDVSAVDANAAMAANTVAVEPGPLPDESAAAPPPPPPPPPRERGFPWGAIGLVGLVGLLGRRRRD